MFLRISMLRINIVPDVLVLLYLNALLTRVSQRVRPNLEVVLNDFGAVLIKEVLGGQVHGLPKGLVLKWLAYPVN